MRKLTVLYDGRCGLCVEARQWISGEPKLLQLEFIATGSKAALRRFPTLAATNPEELVAVDDRGGVYRGERAWITVMYALERYREMALRLASPSMLPLARRLWSLVSSQRAGISFLLGLSDRELASELRNTPEPYRCATTREGLQP